MKKISIFYHANPLKKEEYSLTECIAQDNETVEQLLKRLKLWRGDFAIQLNNEYLHKDEINTQLKANDVIHVYVLAQDPLYIPAVIWTFEAGAVTMVAGSLTALGSFVVSTIASITLNLAVNALTKRRGNFATYTEKSPSLFGIGQATNSTRQYAPLPLGMGKVRLFPDIGQKQLTDYVIDNSDIGIVVSDFCVTEPWQTPAISFTPSTYTPSGTNAGAPYTIYTPTLYTSDISGQGSGNYIYAYSYGSQRTYNAPSSGGGQPYITPCTFVVWSFDRITWKITTYEMYMCVVKKSGNISWLNDINDANGTYSIANTNKYLGSLDDNPNTWLGSNLNTTITNPPITLNVIQYFGYESRTQRLTAVFNAGYGDVTFSDPRIGKTRLADFLGIKANQNTASLEFCTLTNSDSVLNGYQHPDYVSTGLTLKANPAVFKHWRNVGNGLEQVNGHYPSNVDVVAGGTLSRTKNLSTGQESTPLNGWLYRSGGASATGIYAMQIDITGRLFKSDPTVGLMPHAVYLEIYYKYSITTNEQTRQAPPTGWIKYDDNYKIEASNTNGFRKSILIEPSQQAGIFNKNIEVAIRKKNFDPTDSNFTEEVTIEQIKFMQVQTHLYAAQNRIGLQIKATNQINGQLERQSMLGSWKTWVLKNNGGTDEYLPAVSGKKWAWEETSNPAWWYLNFALGGFENKNTPSTHPLNGKGWMLGQHASNTQQLFGLGEEIQSIDLDKIVAWADYCNAKDLRIDYCAMEEGNDDCYTFLSFIARHGRATPHRTIKSGKLSVVFHQAGDPVKAVFGMANIKAGSFALSYNNKKTYDAVVINYPDEAEDYAMKQIRVLVPFVVNPIDTLSFTLKGCTRKNQAQREANLAAAAEFYGTESVSFEVDSSRLLIDRGDVIKITHDVLGYADSGRIIAFNIQYGQIVHVRLNKVLDLAIGAPYYLTVRTPDNELLQFKANYYGPNPDNSLAILNIEEPWDCRKSSYISTEDGEINEYSNYLDSLPGDFIFMGSPQTNYGSEFRVTTIEPNGGLSATITAVREYDEYYACEGAISNATNPQPLPNSNVAKIDSLGILKQDNGFLLHWENKHCLGARLNITTITNGITANGQLVVNSDNVLLPLYVQGTQISITAMPNSIKTDYLQQSSTFNYEVL